MRGGNSALEPGDRRRVVAARGIAPAVLLDPGILRFEPGAVAIAREGVRRTVELLQRGLERARRGQDVRRRYPTARLDPRQLRGAGLRDALVDRAQRRR